MREALAITTKECDAMLAAAKANKCVISTYHNRHWDGCILKALEMIGGGVIGEVTGEWARRPIHILDLADQSTRKRCALKAIYA